MKKVIVSVVFFAMLCGAAAHGQGWPVNGQAISQYGTPVPNAKVRVCSITSTQTPCTPTIAIYSDYQLTQPLPNPMSADQYGNFSFFTAALPSPNLVLVQVTAGTGTTYNYVYPGSITGQFCSLTGCTISGNVTAGSFSTSGSITAPIGIFSSSLSAPSLSPGFNYLTCFGDSLTQNTKDTFTPQWCNVLLASMLKTTASNQGAGGQTGDQICARIGACPTYFTSGFTIPSGAPTPVTVTFTPGFEPAYDQTLNANSTFPNGMLGTANGVLGWVTETNGSTHTYAFTAYSSQTGATTVASGTQWFPVFQNNELNGCVNVWMNRNGIDAIGYVQALSILDQSVAYLHRTTDCVSEMTIPKSEDPAEQSDTNYDLYNSGLLSRYGPNGTIYPNTAIDIVSILDAEADTSNPVDVYDAAHDIIPYSLRAQATNHADTYTVTGMSDGTTCTFTLLDNGTPMTIPAFDIIKVDSEYVRVDSSTSCVRNFPSGGTGVSHADGTTFTGIDYLHEGTGTGTNPNVSSGNQAVANAVQAKIPTMNGGVITQQNMIEALGGLKIPGLRFRVVNSGTAEIVASDCGNIVIVTGGTPFLFDNIHDCVVGIGNDSGTATSVPSANSPASLDNNFIKYVSPKQGFWVYSYAVNETTNVTWKTLTNINPHASVLLGIRPVSDPTVIIQQTDSGSAVLLNTIATTGTASSGSTALTVTSGTNIQVGQNVSGTNIAAGTTVAAVSGTSVTLSLATTGTISGSAVDFSSVSVSLPNIGGSAPNNLILPIYSFAVTNDTPLMVTIGLTGGAVSCNGFPTKISPGDTATFYTAQSGSNIKYCANSPNPMTTTGDLIVGGSGGTPTRLASQNAGLVLTSNGVGATPSWQSAAAASGADTFIYVTGNVTSVPGTSLRFGAHKAAHSGTLQNIVGVSNAFSCTVNPTIQLLDCGLTANTCSGGTAIASITMTAVTTLTDGTISTPAISANHYYAWNWSAGTCTSFQGSFSAQD